LLLTSASGFGLHGRGFEFQAQRMLPVELSSPLLLGVRYGQTNPRIPMLSCQTLHQFRFVLVTRSHKRHLLSYCCMWHVQFAANTAASWGLSYTL